jgi:hypothetical protein
MAKTPSHLTRIAAACAAAAASLGRAAHDALFAHMARSGLILCAAELADQEQEAGTGTGEGEGDDDGAGAGGAEEGNGSQAASDDEGGDGTGAEGDADTDADEVTVTIGDEPAANESDDERRAPEWVRELRKANREKDRKLREQEAEISRLKGGGAAPAATVVGAEPTLESCDFDADRFAQELKAWHERKRVADAEAAKQRQAEEAAQAAWKAKLDAYGRAKAELKVKDYEDAEGAVQDVLSVVQQGVILNGADNPALLVYALGKNPKKAQELGAITDPVKFAFAVAKLETQLKVTPRKAAPLPEKTVRGSAPVTGSVDSHLERLRADAAKTGDYSKVHQYRQQQRSKQK